MFPSACPSIHPPNLPPIPFIRSLQVQAAIDKLRSAPFILVVTEDMQKQFEALLKEAASPAPPPPSSSLASAAAAAAAKRAGEAAGQPAAAVAQAAAAAQQHPAGQLADVLGFEGAVSFRREMEAIALEKRKAVEGKDKAQEALLEQVRGRGGGVHEWREGECWHCRVMDRRP